MHGLRGLEDPSLGRAPRLGGRGAGQGQVLALRLWGAAGRAPGLLGRRCSPFFLRRARLWGLLFTWRLGSRADWLPRGLGTAGRGPQ